MSDTSEPYYSLSHHKSLDTVLRDISTVLSTSAGNEFFYSSVRYLTKTLTADYAFIGELTDGANRVRTLTVYPDDDCADHFEYPLAGTPCEQVVEQGFCHVAAGVQQRFPGNEILADLNAHSYMGTLLQHSDGAPLGVLFVINRVAMPHPDFAESVLQIFAVRASTELHRVQAESEVRKLSRAVHQTDDIVYITDRNGVIEYVNPAFERITGYRRAEAVGTTPRFLQSGKQDNDFYDQLWNTILAGNVFRGVVANRTKSGELYYEQKTITPLKEPDGTITHFVNTGKDVTEQRRSAVALRKSRANLSEAQRIARLGSWKWDLETNELFWSDQIYRIFGVEPQQFGATYDAFLQYVHPDDRTRVQESVRAALHTWRPYDIEHRIVRPDGTERVVHEHAEVITDAAGTPTSMVGTVQDVTEYAQLKTEREQALQEARHRLAELEARYRITRAIVKRPDLDDRLAIVLDETIDLLGADIGAVYLLHCDRLSIEMQRGLPNNALRALETLPRRNQSIQGTVQSAWEEYLESINMQTSVTVPLTVEEISVGSITLASSRPQAFNSETVRTLRHLAEQAGVAIVNARLYSAEQKRRRELTLLYDLTRQLGTTNELDVVLDTVAEHVVEAMNAGFCRVILQTDDGFVCRAACGASSLDIDLKAGQSEPADVHPYYQQVFETDEDIYVLRYDDAEPARVDQKTRRRLLLDGAADTLYLAPLRVSGEPLGVLAIGKREDHKRTRRDPDTRRLMILLADQAAGAIHRASLHEELETSYVETVVALANAVDARDTYTADHSERLAKLALSTAHQLGCSEEEREQIYWAALLHDIGKIGVPDKILKKEGSLTEGEWAIIKRHPEIGAAIIEPVQWLQAVIPLVHAHQERYDGSGYPQGLRGEEIPLGARILAVVDAYSAITDTRPYSDGRSEEEAIAELQRCAGSQFDPHVVEAFLAALAQIDD